MSADSATTQPDPFKVLGIPIDASEDEVRSRYLELVKKYPPEREPEQFRRIQAAYEAARDPIGLAKRLINATDSEDIPTWQSVLERFSAQPPRMSVSFLLSLGNQAAGYVQVREN